MTLLTLLELISALVSLEQGAKPLAALAQDLLSKGHPVNAPLPPSHQAAVDALRIVAPPESLGVWDLTENS